MTMYDVMYEAITEKYENGEITFEQANELNELAYDKYVSEGKLGDFGKAAVGKLKNLRENQKAKRIEKDERRTEQAEENVRRRMLKYAKDDENKRGIGYYLQIGDEVRQFMSPVGMKKQYDIYKNKGLKVSAYKLDKNSGKKTPIVNFDHNDF